MKKTFSLTFLIYSVLFAITANSYILIPQNLKNLIWIIPAFLLINMVAGMFTVKTQSFRLKVCYHGAVLLSVFVISSLLSIIYHIILIQYIKPYDNWFFVWSIVLSVCLHAILFWNGIICVYLTSVQLGIKQRVVGALCGLIPILNLIILNRIIKISYKDVLFETEKEKLNALRCDMRICATKYPILMVHGVFFRDSKLFNYWGRIPKELEINGAEIYYGNHESAASVKDSATELTERIKTIIRKTGAEKVNIIAHSKGGLDCRYAISELDAGKYIASLTTINTPHRGCIFADYLLTQLSEKIKNKVANAYNKTLKELGDDSPDFLAAVNDLTASSCIDFDKQLKVPDEIFCQSVGSVLRKASGGKFPLNLSYHLVKHFDGENDGLVRETAFKWGEKYTLISPSGKRGISHCDMIDLNRENIEGFDVREFYVKLVSDLKDRGL